MASSATIILVFDDPKLAIIAEWHVIAIEINSGYEIKVGITLNANSTTVDHAWSACRVSGVYIDGRGRHRDTRS